jgi:hypothetical protein
MKKLGALNNDFSYDNSYVRLGSVTTSDPRHYTAIPGNDKWENMRYCLEKTMGCFKFTLPMKVVQNSYLSATYHYSVTGVPPGTVLTSKTQVYSGDIVVITRHPQPKHLHAYVPAKYWSDLGDVPTGDVVPEEEEHGNQEEQKASTEDDRLNMLFQQQPMDHREPHALPPIVVRMLKQRVLHPTDYVTLTTPHPLFVCQYCNSQGKHFHTLCPFTETDARQNTTELLTKVRRLVGIPKSRLRMATADEIAQGSYYLNEANEKVVILKKEDSVPEKTQADKKRAREQENFDVNYNFYWDHSLVEEQFKFDFEPYIEEQDRLEQQREAEFYAKHPALKKKKNQICTHYYRGMCHKGKLECEFLHTGDENYIAICQFFVNGQCTEANCQFRHPDRHVFNNECNAYRRGFCEKGRQCKYKHVRYSHPADNPELDPKVCNLMVKALCTVKRSKFIF